MHRPWIEAALLVGLAFALAGPLSAQQRQQLAPAQPSIMDEDEDTVPAAPPHQPAKPARMRGQTAAPALERDPDLDAEDQLAPSQMHQPMPAAVSTPSGGSHTRGTEAMAEPGPAAKSSRIANPRIVACSGLFGRNSSHLKLTAAFRAKNVAVTQVDTASGAKVTASVLFAKDPKQRLEVWWSKPESHSDIHLIVINGQSDWTAPGELRLGLTLADLERLNGKPFKLSGFDKNNVASVSNWNGGEFAGLAGGCRVGVSLRAAPTATPAALSDLPADREFSSADGALRAANPTVSEILVGY